MGFWVGTTPKTLTMYEIIGNEVVIPRGLLHKLPCEITYEFTGYEDLPKEYRFEGLYDYQSKAVNKVLRYLCGILQGACGCGKTTMGLEIAFRSGLRTLWVAHTKELLAQAKERAISAGVDVADIGYIGDGKVTVGNAITFATVQTLSKMDLSLYRHVWGTIIIDEAHHVFGGVKSYSMYSHVLNSLDSRYRYGLTATVHRSDGLIECTKALLGDVIAEISDEDVADKVVPVEVVKVVTDLPMSYEVLDTDGTLNHNALVNYIAEDKARNEQIINLLGDEPTIILSDRVKHLGDLYGLLNSEQMSKAVVITGKTKTEYRQNALDDMRSGKVKYLLATYALAKEGLDIPRASVLILATPQKDYAVVTQSIGRIARAYEGKTKGTCYDLVDEEIGYCDKAWKKRKTTYRKKGVKVCEKR